MSVENVVEVEWLNGAVVTRGIVVEIASSGDVWVQSEGELSSIIACDVISTIDQLESGARVLFCPPASPEGRGCVLGRIARYVTLDSSGADHASAVAERNLVADKQTIELTAETKLVLKCGEGSISIERDGTIIIKGARILSRSKGVNKIKGAAVQIN